MTLKTAFYGMEILKKVLYAYFTGAYFYEMNFEGAKLDGAKILEKYKDKLELSEEQIAVIDWIEGGVDDEIL